MRASLRIGRASVRDRHRAVESESAMSAADDVIGICRASRRTKIWSSSPGNVRQFVHNIAPAPPSGAVESGRTGADPDSAHAEVEAALTLVAHRQGGRGQAAPGQKDQRERYGALQSLSALMWPLIAGRDDPFVIRLRTSRVVELPNAYQVTPLMILAAWGTPTTRPAAATKPTKRSAKRSKSCSKRAPTSIGELPRARPLAAALRGRNATLRFLAEK